MQELIIINYENDKPTVNGRDFSSFLSKSSGGCPNIE